MPCFDSDSTQRRMEDAKMLGGLGGKAYNVGMFGNSFNENNEHYDLTTEKVVSLPSFSTSSACLSILSNQSINRSTFYSSLTQLKSSNLSPYQPTYFY